MNLKKIYEYILGLLNIKEEELLYIAGENKLPVPLSQEEEKELLEKLNKKVPQMKHVPWMKEYYGIWSQVAHNASFDSLDLLGYYMDDEVHKRYYAQPTYTENTIETLNMNIGLFMIFGLEVLKFLENTIPGYKPVEGREFLLSFNRYGSKTNIPYFDSLKGIEGFDD